MVQINHHRRKPERTDMRDIISKLNDLRDEVLALRDEANHNEYTKYGELYEAVTEAFDIANRNFPGVYA